ncbi:hypothetical protein [Actinoplanes sp. CA-252034]|uniref:hypothetical protein n=1 Tax=Actinoplanes sp. CA-252034 TaxID=3239906 RepID=UPI003D96165A
MAGLLGITEEQVRAALDALFDLALLRESTDAPQGIHIVAPEIGLRSALARQQADLARRQQEVAQSQAVIARLVDDLSRSERASGPVASELLGMDAVRDQLQLLAQEARDEVMTLMPGGAQSPRLWSTPAATTSTSSPATCGCGPSGWTAFAIRRTR